MRVVGGTTSNPQITLDALTFPDAAPAPMPSDLRQKEFPSLVTAFDRGWTESVTRHSSVAGVQVRSLATLFSPSSSPSCPSAKMGTNTQILLVFLFIFVFCLSGNGVYAFGAGNIPRQAPRSPQWRLC